MPRACTICTHPDRAAIDRALVLGMPALRHIASEYGVSTSALQRHKDTDLPLALVKAHDVAEVARADTLIDEVRDLQDRTLALLTKAEASDRLPVAVMCIREARGNLELLAKLAGKLQTAPTLNVLLAPEWLSVRTVLLTALLPFPEARTAVAGALMEIEAHDDRG